MIQCFFLLYLRKLSFSELAKVSFPSWNATSNDASASTLSRNGVLFLVSRSVNVLSLIRMMLRCGYRNAQYSEDRSHFQGEKTTSGISLAKLDFRDTTVHFCSLDAHVLFLRESLHMHTVTHSLQTGISHVLRSLELDYSNAQ